MKRVYRAIGVLVLMMTTAQAQVTETKLTPSDSQVGDLFGISIALDGDYLLVGAPGVDDGVGAAYIFRRTDTGWVEEARLTASDRSTEEDFNDFGWAVALEGDYAVIGAARTRFPSLNAIPDEKGAAYVFARTQNGWVEQEKLTPVNPTPGEFFGRSLSISGSRVIIGADELKAGESKGAAYIFELRDNDWVLTSRLTASDAFEQAGLGYSVWLSGDVALVGAPGCCVGRNGATYVFEHVNGAWQEQAKLEASDGVEAGWFGGAIAGSNDLVIIGSEGWAGNRGKAYIFQQTQNGWEQQGDMKPGFFDHDALDQFGTAVALSGDFALVGASHFPKDEPGAAFLFKRTDTGWEEQLKLTASDEVNGNTFGWSVAFNGKYAIIGAPGYSTSPNKTGAVYIYDVGTVVSVQEQPTAIPKTFRLEQNYPNPFNPTTVIRYRLPTNSQVELTIFNRLGQHIKTLVKGKQGAGSHEIVWDGTDARGRNAASGVYVYRLRAGELVATKKMILMR